jgi:hypothetical protein
MKQLMKAPKQLKTLDDLMAQAAHYADFCLRNSGRMPATLFLIGDDGPLMLIPESLAGEQEKDDFANTSRMVCIAHNASACVMALEAWLKTAKPGEPFDVTEPPSEALDREEVVVLMGEESTGQRQQFLNIIRSGNGKFFGLTPNAIPLADSMTGRFAHILPSKAPDEAAQMLAKTILKVRGSKTVYLGNRVHRRS